MASAYVESLRQRDLEKIDREEKLRNFRQTYKKQIEDGLTESQFRESRYTTQEDIDLYRKIAEEVRTEELIGQAFLKGFCGEGAK